MILFECDYQEGCHPSILELLNKTNMEQSSGYGMDSHCEKAKEMIKAHFACPNADVHFLVGGTQTNDTVIDYILSPWEGVLSPDTGHINVHETGAVESSGHKVLQLPNTDGKVTAQQVKKAIDDAGDEHTIQPGMLYISFSTEYGTIYTRQELQDLYEVCSAGGIYLFIDGARLGYGLAADDCDVKPEDIAKNCDVFYVGGTKIGALFGEAVVFTNPELGNYFRNVIKQHGGMLAKGRLLGIQFEGLMKDELYLQLGKRADVQADIIREALTKAKIEIKYPNRTNQIFCVLSDSQLEQLSREFKLSIQGRTDDGSNFIRICTSWATLDENVEKLVKAIGKL